MKSGSPKNIAVLNYQMKGPSGLNEKVVILRVGNDSQLSNEKNPGWLGYIGDETTQLYRGL